MPFYVLFCSLLDSIMFCLNLYSISPLCRILQTPIGPINFAIRNLAIPFKVLTPTTKKLISMSLVNTYFNIVTEILKLEYDEIILESETSSHSDQNSSTLFQPLVNSPRIDI